MNSNRKCKQKGVTKEDGVLNGVAKDGYEQQNSINTYPNPNQEGIILFTLVEIFASLAILYFIL